MDGDYDPRFNLSGQGLMPMAEVNNPRSLWKQVLSNCSGWCAFPV